MTSAPLPPDEAQRLRALRSLGVLNTPPEERYDRVTRLAQRLFGVPIVLVSLVEETRQWFKSVQGLNARETSREVSFCAHAILRPGIFVVNDATQDERFRDNPLVRGEPGIRFYAGEPLISKGQPVGTLCLIDRRPRTLSEADRHLLRDLAGIIEDQLHLVEADKLQHKVNERTAELAQAKTDLELEIDRQRITEEALRAATDDLRSARDELEIRVQERAAELDRFFTLSLDMLVISGFDGRFRRLNPAWEKILGWSCEDMVARPYIEFVHPDDRAATVAEAEKLNAGEITASFENRYLCKDGSYKWLAWTASPSPEQELIYAVARDLTERKLAERRLETQFASLGVLTEAHNLDEAARLILPIIGEGLDWDVGALWSLVPHLGSLVAVDVWHRQSVVVTHFECHTRKLVLPPGVGLPGRVWVAGEPEWIPDVARDPTFIRAEEAERENLHTALAFPIRLGSEVLGVLEFYSRKPRQPDDSLLEMLTVLSGQIGQFMERKRAESALAERAHLAALGADVGLALTQEKQLSCLLRRGVVALVRHLNAVFARLWTLNTETNVLELQTSAGLYTRTNGTYSRLPLTGPTKIAQIARTREPLLSNEIHAESFVQDPAWSQSEGLVAFAGYPLIVEDQLLGVVALFSSQPLSHAAFGAIGSVADGLALGMKRILTEAEMRHARVVAEEANRAKSDFLAKMSHELRTPLNSVIGFANVLMKNKAKNLRDQDLTFLTRILENGKHLLALINHVLDIAKVEAGKMELELGPVDVGNLVREVICQLEGQPRARGVILSGEVPGGLSELQADAGKLKQVLINLVGNALKFTETGSVTVRVRADAAGRPEVIEVIDTGVGIPPDRLGAVFEAFQQADNSTGRQYGGTGLGLTISRSLCQLMGYLLEVESEPGKGTTFRIRLAAPPSDVSPSPTRAPVSSNGETPLAGKRVLVVDDEADSRLLLASYLGGEGAELLLASDGKQALTLLDDFSPDLVLLDLMMPGVDGAAFLEAMRREPRFAGLPVLVVTGKDLTSEQERRLATETVGVIKKGAELESTLKRVLRRALIG